MTQQKNIYFIRHGEAQHNEAMRVLGHDAVYDENTRSFVHFRCLQLKAYLRIV